MQWNIAAAKRIVILGVLLAVLLALAWVDIALDAGLVNVNGVKPRYTLLFELTF